MNLNIWEQITGIWENTLNKKDDKEDDMTE